MGRSSYDDWGEFTVAVEEKYGLSKKQILDAFYSMKPSSDESEGEFIMRVEDMRMRYGESSDMCFRHFVPQLSLDFRK
jgi:hypothetical protein